MDGDNGKNGLREKFRGIRSTIIGASRLELRIAAAKSVLRGARRRLSAITLACYPHHISLAWGGGGQAGFRCRRIGKETARETVTYEFTTSFILVRIRVARPRAR